MCFCVLYMWHDMSAEFSAMIGEGKKNPEAECVAEKEGGD